MWRREKAILLDTSFISPRYFPQPISSEPCAIFKYTLAISDDFFFNFPAKFQYLHHFSIFVKFGLARGFLLQALQCSVILIILFITVVTNISIVLNIRNSEIKRRIVSFVLIKNLCIVDTVGAMLILPVPLAATFRGDLSNCDLDAAQIVPAMSPRGSTFY